MVFRQVASWLARVQIALVMCEEKSEEKMQVQNVEMRFKEHGASTSIIKVINVIILKSNEMSVRTLDKLLFYVCMNVWEGDDADRPKQSGDFL